MKTAKLFSALFLSSALLTTACTPKDEAITDKATRDRILEQKNRKASAGKKPGQSGFKFQFGTYASMAFQVGKVVETMEVIRFALDSKEVNKSIYKAESKKSADGTSDSVTLTADKVETNYATSQGDFSTNVSKKWDIDVTYVDGKLATLKAVATKSFTKLDQKNLEKTFVNLKEDESVIEVSNNAGVLSVKVTGNGVVNGRLKNAPAHEKFQFAVSFETSLEQLLAAKADIRNADSKLVYLKDNGKEWISSYKGSKDFSVELQGLCNAVNFVADLKGKTPKKMKSDKDGIEVSDSKFKSTYGACGFRPTLDLSLMLLY